MAAVVVVVVAVVGLFFFVRGTRMVAIGAAELFFVFDVARHGSTVAHLRRTPASKKNHETSCVSREAELPAGTSQGRSGAGGAGGSGAQGSRASGQQECRAAGIKEPRDLRLE